MAIERSRAPSLSRTLAWLNRPRDAAGLAAFRILFGAVMLFAVTRFWSKGWIHELYIAPAYHFTYLGFDWVRPWPGWGMYAHFAVMGLAAAGILLGLRTRLCAFLFFATFTYAELLDKATYLNHYYLVSLLALLLVFTPSDAMWSVDSRRRGGNDGAAVGRWAYLLLRGQVATVYLFAGLAKLNGDWLLRAEPLDTWLQMFAHLPLVGSLLGERWVAYAMSWGGAAYDLSIVPLLLWSRTRVPAYGVTVLFHVTVWILFPIGVFSWVMLISATLMFDPAWPRRVVGVLRSATSEPVTAQVPLAGGRSSLALPGAVLLAAWLAAQTLLPLRHVLYPGPTNWTEEGFRFAWRVMLIEKTGLVEYQVATDGDSRHVVLPREELTPLQHKMLSTQPDLIHQYALHLADRFRRRGHTDVEVYVDAWAALNGRPSQRLVDPEVDLAREPRDLGAKPWLVPLRR